MIHAWHYHQNGKIDFFKSSFLDTNCYEISILFMKRQQIGFSLGVIWHVDKMLTCWEPGNQKWQRNQKEKELKWKEVSPGRSCTKQQPKAVPSCCPAVAPVQLSDCQTWDTHVYCVILRNQQTGELLNRLWKCMRSWIYWVGQVWSELQRFWI